MASEIPQAIVLKRHRDLEGLRSAIWIRRGFLLLFAAIPVAALVNVFGQRPSPVTTSAPAASLQLYAPVHLRGGLLWEARFHITARTKIKDAYLVLGPGWAEGMQMNTIEPSPEGETSDNGSLSFELGPIDAGESHILFMQFQVNPTNVTFGREQTVTLRDGQTLLLTFKRHLTVFP